MSKKIPSRLVVSFVGQKGGVGKSALARLLAVAAAMRGSKVLLADFDAEQLTSAHWGRRRAEGGVSPEIVARGFKSLKKLRKSEGRWDLIVADSRGLADGLTREIAEESDVVFLPTSASIDDLTPTLDLARRLADKGAAGRVVLVFSKTTRSQRQISAAKDLVAAAGFELLPKAWPLRDGVQTELDAGRTGLESNNAVLRTTVAATADALIERVFGPSPRPVKPRRPKRDAAAAPPPDERPQNTSEELS